MTTKIPEIGDPFRAAADIEAETPITVGSHHFDRGGRPMTIVELATLMRAMRRAQRDYFKTRTATTLSAAMRLEREVDAAVARILAEPTPFDGDDAEEGGPDAGL